MKTLKMKDGLFLTLMVIFFFHFYQTTTFNQPEEHFSNFLQKSSQNRLHNNNEKLFLKSNKPILSSDIEKLKKVNFEQKKVKHIPTRRIKLKEGEEGEEENDESISNEISQSTNNENSQSTNNEISEDKSTKSGTGNEEEYQFLAKEITSKIPEQYECQDEEHKKTCKDKLEAKIKFGIKYQVDVIKTGGNEKKTFYTIILTNGLKADEEPNEYHGTFKVKFEKDSKGSNLGNKLAWLFGTSTTDLSKVNFFAELRKSIPTPVANIKNHDQINRILMSLFTNIDKTEGVDSILEKNTCKWNPQVKCYFALYAANEPYMRIDIKIGKNSINYSFTRINFEENFGIYAASIDNFIKVQISAQQGGLGDNPINKEIIKQQIQLGITNGCRTCSQLVETNSVSIHNDIYARSFTNKKTVNKVQVDEKYNIIGVYYDQDHFSFEHILLDNDVEMEELLLNTASNSFPVEFSNEFQEFMKHDYSQQIQQGKEFVITLESVKLKFENDPGMKQHLTSCQIVDADGGGLDINCGTANVLRVREITTDDDDGFVIDYMITFKDLANRVPETGVVLQKINIYDQLSIVMPEIVAYIARVIPYLAKKWFIL